MTASKTLRSSVVKEARGCPLRPTLFAQTSTFCFANLWSREIEIIRLFSIHLMTIHLRSRYRINPRSTRFCSARPVNIDDLQSRMWVHGLGGERLPATSYALSLNVKKMPIFCHRRGIKVFCRLFYIHQRLNVFSQTPGRHPPHITGLRVNSVTIGWVKPLTTATRSDFMTQSLFLPIDV